jgi:hypothetical protein
MKNRTLACQRELMCVQTVPLDRDQIRGSQLVETLQTQRAFTCFPVNLTHSLNAVFDLCPRVVGRRILLDVFVRNLDVVQSPPEARAAAPCCGLAHVCRLRRHRPSR